MAHFKRLIPAHLFGRLMRDIIKENINLEQMRRRLLSQIIPTPEIIPMTMDAGGVVLYDKTTKKTFQTSNIEAFSPDNFEPIGVIIIPSSHNVYGTGEAGVIALDLVGPDSPGYGVSLPFTTVEMGDATKLTGINIFDHFEGYEAAQTPGVFDKQTSYWTTPSSTPTIPADGPITSMNNSYLKETNIIPVFVNVYPNSGGYPSTDERYSYGRYNGSGPSGINTYSHIIAIMPPFDLDDNFKSLYKGSQPGCASSDFNGKENSRKILSQITGQDDWKTSPTILSGDGCYPAAELCWRYSTLGTKNGDWYLPAIGEIGYVEAKNYRAIFSNINTHFKKSYLYPGSGPYGWGMDSSTVADTGQFYSACGSPNAWGVYFGGKQQVRPMMRGKFPIRNNP